MWSTVVTSAFYAGVARCGPTRDPWGVTFASVCAALGAEVPKFDVTHNHDPLNDATLPGLEAAHVLRLLDARAATTGGGLE